MTIRPELVTQSNETVPIGHWPWFHQREVTLYVDALHR